MGMFDTIITDHVRCIMCGCNLIDLQTKDGECILKDYRVGDKFPLRMGQNKINAYTSCVHEWESADKNNPFVQIGLPVWKAVHGIWIDVEIPVDCEGEILPEITWKIKYEKTRMRHGTCWTNMKSGEYDPRSVSAEIGDAIRKYYGTVKDGLSWEEVINEDAT